MPADPPSSNPPPEDRAAPQAPREQPARAATPDQPEQAVVAGEAMPSPAPAGPPEQPVVAGEPVPGQGDAAPRPAARTAAEQLGGRARDRGVALEVQLVTELATMLRKTVKTFTLYGATGKTSQDFLQRLSAVFSTYLDENGPLTVRIDSSTLKFRDEAVLSEESDSETYLYRLYADGIRRLTFRPGLTLDELADFVEILALEPGSPALRDDDMVTLFWKKDFSHLHYVVVEAFTESAGSVAAEGSVDFETALAQMLKLVDEEVPAGEMVRSARIAAEDLQVGPLEDLPEALRCDSEDPAHVFSLSPAELRRVHAEVLADAADDDLNKVIDILSEMLAWEASPPEAGEVLEVLILLLDTALTEGRLGVASRVVGSLRWLTVPRRDGFAYPEAAVSAARRGLVEACLTERVRPFLQQLVERPDRRQQALDHLRSLPPEAAEPIADLLQEVPSAKDRTELCELLMHLARDRADIFIDRLTHDRAFVVLEMIRILTALKPPQALPALVKTYQHANPKIRTAVVRATRAFDHKDLKFFLSHAMQDSDPAVRLQAIRELARFPGDDMVVHLMGQLDDPAFPERPQDEQREFFRTLGAVGSAALLPTLEEIAAARGVRKKAQLDGMRAGAIMAISLIGGAEAAAVLDRLASESLSGRLTAVLRRARETLAGNAEADPGGADG